MKKPNTTNNDSKALVVLSGGLDSTVCLYLAYSKYKEVLAISFDYSQKHKIELKKAQKTTKLLGIQHQIVKIPTGIFQGSSLTDFSIKVPKNFLGKTDIPNTYVPGRNILLLSFAVSFAESRSISDIFIGVNALDYSGYPDCRPDFIEAFEKAINLGTRTGDSNKKIHIRTPLINLTKKDIVILGNKLNVPFSLTHSCYDPDTKGKPCGKCDSCLLRNKGFLEAGIEDK
jgi:7-cyano-7-deazaguanine synthase